MFCGRIDDILVFAGGANFTDSQDGRRIKTWWDDAYTYNTKTGEWRVFEGVLPQKNAYGASVETDGGLLCAGGCNADACLDSVFLLKLDDDGKPFFEIRQSLPSPLANMAWACVRNTLYLAGGIDSMENPTALRVFYALDLSHPVSGWQILEPWPGEARAFAVGTAQSDGLDHCFYLFGGRDFSSGEAWDILTDAWAYNPRLHAWQTVKGEFPVMAGTAMPMGTNHILFVGGALEGNIRFNGLRLYHTVTSTMTDIPVEGVDIPVTSTILDTGDGFLLASGEVAPTLRTPVILQARHESRIKAMGSLDIMVIIIYFASLVGIGWYFSCRQKNVDDYFKGGGRIPWFIVGLSIFGTGLSAITFMAIPAKAYATDWSYLLFNAGIVLVVPLIVLMFIPFFRKLNITTAYEYLERRFNPFVRVICSAVFIIYQIGRMGVVLLLPSIALNVVTGFDIFLCIGLMGILALIYTYVGGIEAVAWTDALQVVVLLGAAIAVVWTVCSSADGGLGGVIASAAQDGKFNLGSLRFDLRMATVWTVLIATVFTNITTYGTDQTIVQRYLTTATEKQARKGVYTNALLCIPATVLFFFVGTCIYVYFKQNPAGLSAAIENPDAILPWYVSIRIPQGVVGLVIAGIFAAAMSTVSASMNSAATAYITDIRSKTDASKNSDTLKAAKRATVVIGALGIVFALMMATWDVKSLWDEFSKILGILLGGLGGLFLLAFTSRKANSAGAIAGLAGCMVVQLIVMHNQSVYLLLYSTVGFVSCYLIGWMVSLLTGGPRKNIDGLTIIK
ncbi:MAG: sodium/solute symporter [Bacteroidales bacterium]|nr:sodium/solute symporter [Bacteroidales bacterium]